MSEPHHQLPNELILEVLRGLSQEDLLAFASASKAFCMLARTLLFDDCHVQPYSLTNDVLHLPTGEDHADAVQKLTFYTSPSIAPLVKTVNVNYSWRHAQRGVVYGARFSGDGATHSLLELFFSLIGHISPDATPSLPTIRVSHIDLFRVEDGLLWLAILDPDALQTSEIYNVRASQIATQPSKVFPNTRKLFLQSNWSTIFDSTSNLTRTFPSVEELEVDETLLGSPSGIPNPFPRLKRLTTWHPCLAHFLPGAPVERLTVLYCNGDELRSILRSIPPARFPKTITSLSICLDSSAALADILSFFPTLEKLDVVLYGAVDEEWGVVDDTLAILHTVPSQLPPRLQRLSLICELDIINGAAMQMDTSSWEEHVASPQSVHDRLLERSPRLADVIIDLPLFELRWEVGSGFVTQLVGAEWRAANTL
ncbi:F-box domain-containing protein [Mycena kentingensis (nom. inval.)]|nr:F-box domain-containing protein [Mycena kentingensis (nom. inval.)]